MSLRTRLLLAFALVVFIPIALLAFGLRREMSARLTDEYQRRLDQVVATIREDLDRESAGIASRLESLTRALVADNRFRAAAVGEVEAERPYLLDYAGTAMQLTGLSMLQIQDGEGRIVSSGHFRNEHGRLDAGVAAAVAAAHGPAFLTARNADRQFLALVRSESFSIAGRPFAIVGGIAVDAAFLAQLARDSSIVVTLSYPGGQLSTMASGEGSGHAAKPGTGSDVAIGELRVPIVQTAADAPAKTLDAQLQVTQSLAPLKALLRSTDSWLLAAAAGTTAAALLLGVWLSSRVSARLAALADKTAVLDLDRLDVEFDPGSDEVGTLSRLLGDLAARLRTSTVRVREAERRATIGDLARQINHDIKNGLIPLRNVMRHLAQVERDEPAALPQVLAERRPTIDSSIAYLETLATSYQRLSRPADRRECDVNALVAEVVRGVQGREDVECVTDLAEIPTAYGDPVAFRRILENLIANAVDSLHSKPGRITISTRLVARDDDARTVRVVVADSGRGMNAEEAGRIFNDFYTTKEGGTGLGLSIVRRLVMDMNGTVSVDSTPGKGTRMIVDLPASGGQRT